MAPNFKVLLSVFLTRDIGELEQIRDSKFDMVTSGKSNLVSSSIDGAAFQFNVGGTLTPLDVVMLAQTALDYKRAGINRPVTSTQALFI
jgi:hypothetical protein